MPTPNKALVLGGGGSRGSYEVGVWRALAEHGWRPDIITGTSVGALNGAMAAQGRMDEAAALWLELTTDMVMNLDSDPERVNIGEQLHALTRDFLGKRGADTSPLRELLERYIDEDTVRASPIQFGLVMVSLAGMRPRTVYVDEIPRGRLIDYLLASAACYPAMQGQLIDGALYIDGGYHDNIPVELAVTRGALDVIAVDLHAPGIHRRVWDSGVIVRYITPEWELGGILNFNPETARRNMRLGYLDGKKFYGEYAGVLYAFDDSRLWDELAVINSRVLELEEQLTPRVALPGGIDVSERSAALLRWHLLRHVRRYYRRHNLPKKRMALTLPEMAGRLWGLDAERVYTLAEFNAELLRAVNDYEREGKPLDPRSICADLLHELTYPGENSAAKLYTAGLVRSTELLSAIYIRTIEN
jgi:NTE family protein